MCLTLAQRSGAPGLPSPGAWPPSALARIGPRRAAPCAGCLGYLGSTDHLCQQNARTWNRTVRPRLVRMCRDRPDYCDAAFTGGRAGGLCGRNCWRWQRPGGLRWQRNDVGAAWDCMPQGGRGGQRSAVQRAWKLGEVWQSAARAGAKQKPAGRWAWLAASVVGPAAERARPSRPAAHAGIVQADEEGERLIKAAFGVAPRMPWAEQVARFKYVVNVAGNGVPTSRATAVLAAPIVPLWQQTEGREFFYDALQPYRHYVPLAQGLQDLYAAIDWARGNPDASRRIAQEGQAFARRHFNADFLSRYMLALLSEYARLQRFTPNVTAGYQRLLMDDAMLAAVNRSAGGCEHGAFRD